MATKLLNAMKSILILLCITATINAQTPPMPQLPPMMMREAIKSNIVTRAQAKRPKTFTTTCPHCGMKFSNMHPTLIMTNGGVNVPGGVNIQRTLTFDCVNRGCLESFQSQNTVFQPESIAVEDEPPADGGAGGGATQTYTNNPNLRLAIEILNKGVPFVLLGVTNSQVVSNTITLGISPVPMAAIRFPTELGKSYKCQATDDAKQTWIDGPVLAGTGHYVTNYEMPVKMSRMYRVVENPM